MQGLILYFKYTIILAFLPFLGTLGCYASKGTPPKKASKAQEKSLKQNHPLKPVLKVGKYGFTQEEINLRKKHILWKYGSYGEEKANLAAYYQLIFGYLFVEVLEKLGYGITQETLQKELQRIDANTKRPKLLEELKKLYGDRDRYGKIGILPDFANGRYSFEVFPKLKQIQRPVKKKAFQLLQRILKSQKKDLKSWVGEKGERKWGYFLFHPRHGFLPLPKEREPIRKEEIQRWKNFPLEGERKKLFEKMEKGIFAKLKKGEIFPQVVELDQDFSLFRSLGWYDAKEGIRKVERLWIRKISPQDYLFTQTRHIPLWIKDPQIRNKLFQKYPWMREMPSPAKKE